MPPSTWIHTQFIVDSQRGVDEIFAQTAAAPDQGADPAIRCLSVTVMHIVEFAFVAYPATNRDRARAFYEGVLGLSSGLMMENGDEFWVEYEVGPHTLGIGNEPFLKPSAYGPQLVLEVGDFDEAVAHLRLHGVPFAVEPFDLPACRAAVVCDPDGNQLGIHQRNQESPNPNQ